MRGIHYAAIAILCFVAFTIAQCNRARAAGGCGRYEVYAGALDKKYHEVPHAKGIHVSTAIVVQLFVSPQGTFTVLAIHPSGVTCIVAAGEHWIENKPEIAGEKL